MLHVYNITEPMQSLFETCGAFKSDSSLSNEHAVILSSASKTLLKNGLVVVTQPYFIINFIINIVKYCQTQPLG